MFGHGKFGKISRVVSEAESGLTSLGNDLFKTTQVVERHYHLDDLAAARVQLQEDLEKQQAMNVASEVIQDTQGRIDAIDLVLE